MSSGAAAGPLPARVGELEIAYETFGSAGDPALLLIMGLASQMIAWPDEFCVALADAGSFVIRFDNRDIGLSTHLTSAATPDPMKLMLGDASDAAYRLDDMADDAVGLLDVLGIESAHLVGASMGGMIAQTAAIRHPHRVRTLTSIMSTTAPEVGRPTRAAQAALLAPPARDRHQAGERAVEAFRVIGSPGYALDEDAVADVGRRSYDRAHDPAGVLRQLAAIGASGDRTAALKQLSVPALVIHGADDPLVTLAGGHATAEALAGSRLLVIPGMGHDLPRELWPMIVAAIVDLTRNGHQQDGRR